MAPLSSSRKSLAVAVVAPAVLTFVLLLQLSPLCLGARPRHHSSGASPRHHSSGAPPKPPTNATSRWSPAGATWYGPPDGAGSDGGACGYGTAVGKAPFSSLVAAGSPSLFQLGRGCGACYQVRCTANRACSGKPVDVVITDECPGGPCFAEHFHFDLSGTAIGAMALPGHADQLRAVGILPVEFTRVACNYPGRNVAFRVDAGSNPDYLAVLIEFEDGDGDLAGVSLLERGSSLNAAGTTRNHAWRNMVQSWGAVWKLDAGAALQPPLSIRLTSRYSDRTLIARDVIPVGWKPGATYRALVNFEDN